MNDWIFHLIEGGGYWGIAFLMALENIFPPIPSEVIMGIGGISVAHGRMAVAPLMIAGTIGSTLGNYAWFLLGRALGYERLKPFVDRFGRWLTMDWEDVARLVVFFQKHGQWVVFVMRFSPFMRTLISLPAGLARMGHVRFLVFTLAGAAVWNAILVWAGWHLGRNFGALEKYTGPVAAAGMVLLALVYAWRVVRWKPRER
ncbi:DedA family protein [Novosphingobium olei]|uniref:DedA family protein n=1 Tax=Novosphingobium olei TaxID=2728851 RepID=A0A7Y0BPT5_9SPHN|nr:DedA family protein [Novosphingobium olei]NML94259.1 DedA family protein [Novosphingobium olei]BEV00767.1 DedA family protein [Novosphingobium olei]